MTAPADHEQWRITVVADDDGQPPMALRVRAWIKSALRRYGLRVIWYEGSGPPEDTTLPAEQQAEPAP